MLGSTWWAAWARVKPAQERAALSGGDKQEETILFEHLDLAVLEPGCPLCLMAV